MIVLVNDAMNACGLLQRVKISINAV